MHSLSEVAEYKSEGCCAEEEVIPAFSLDQLSSPRPPTQRTTGRPALALKGEPVVVTYLFRHPRARSSRFRFCNRRRRHVRPHGKRNARGPSLAAPTRHPPHTRAPISHAPRHPSLTLRGTAAPSLRLCTSRRASAPTTAAPRLDSPTHPSSPTPPARAGLSTTLALPDDLLFPEDCQR